MPSLRTKMSVSCWHCFSLNLSLRKQFLRQSHWYLAKSFLVCDGRNLSPWILFLPCVCISDPATRCKMGNCWWLTYTCERWLTGVSICATVPAATMLSTLLSNVMNIWIFPSHHPCHHLKVTSFNMPSGISFVGDEFLLYFVYFQVFVSFLFKQ